LVGQAIKSVSVAFNFVDMQGQRPYHSHVRANKAAAQWQFLYYEG